MGGEGGPRGNDPPRGGGAAGKGRGADIARLLGEVSGAAATEADAVFTTERLTTQHARILQRLEHEGRSRRVITFPSGHGQGSSALRTRPGMRWIAAAAAAGLVIGLLAGHFAPALPGGGTMPASHAAVRPATATLHAVSTTLSEEEFLGRLEIAIEGTSGLALRPLDDLTPRVWEVAAP